MISINKFTKVTLVKNRLILISEKNKKEIPISEVDKVYITVDKLAPIYTFSYILLSIAFMLFSIWYLPFDMILIAPSLLIIAAGIKLKKHKSYGLKICLKNGDYFKKQLPSELKYDTIEIVNCIRKEIFAFNIEKGKNIILHYQRPIIR
ncbi:hypothetical protein [Flavobacterium sp. LB2R40]|uniref:hypothetical protein n=1 Tax=unclassified Flavobacterium TaxID=196869 RepID=UPI003AAE0A1E